MTYSNTSANNIYFAFQGKTWVSWLSVQFSTIQSLSHVWLCDSMNLHYPRLPCLSPALWTCSNSCPLSWWCHPNITSSVILFSSCLQSFPSSGSFPVSQFFASSSQSIGVSASASVLPVNIQDWFPLELSGLISLQSGLCIVKAMVFPVVMYGCESWTIKKVEQRKIDAFELWYWESLGLQGDPTSPS